MQVAALTKVKTPTLEQLAFKESRKLSCFHCLSTETSEITSLFRLFIQSAVCRWNQENQRSTDFIQSPIEARLSCTGKAVGALEVWSNHHILCCFLWCFSMVSMDDLEVRHNFGFAWFCISMRQFAGCLELLMAQVKGTLFLFKTFGHLQLGAGARHRF